MKFGNLRDLTLLPVAFAAAILFSSCTVDEDAALNVKASQRGSSSEKKEDEGKTWAEKMKEKEAARKEAAEERRKELAEKRAKDAAEKEKALAEKAKADEKAAVRQAMADKKKADKEAREKKLADAREAFEKKKELEERKAAAKKKAEELAEKRKAEAEKRRELAESGSSRRSSGGGLGGLFSGLGSTPSKYKSKGHDVYINNRVLSALNESNAKIEIDLSDQKARIYKTGAGGQQLAIETQVSTGKPGHSTSTGTFRIKEKLVEKRSTLYGRWVNSSGQTITSDGDSRYRPSGGSSFVGASMPYWMRINGGIGMHIGYVPNFPASHGCIRVPSAVQPLIYSKVGVGTSVTITQ